MLIVMPTLKQLRYLAALAAHRHFGRAAAACHVSQPALTQQLQQLEERLGIRLVERARQGVLLTAIGQEIAVRARGVLAAMDDLVETAREAREPGAGPLRLGVIPTIGPYLLPGLVPRLRAALPGLRLNLREDQTARLVAGLGAGELDLLLLALPIEAPAVRTLALFDEPFLVALLKGHPLAAKSAIAERDLAGEPVLLLGEGHCLRDQALAVCRQARAEASWGVQATSLATLTAMVAGGLGITFLPQMATAGEGAHAEGLVLRPFAPPVPTRTIGLAWRAASARAKLFQAIGDLIAKTAPGRPA